MSTSPTCSPFSRRGGRVRSVSISGNIAIVSASGSAYIYRKSGATWVEEQKLLACDGAMDDNFGLSVSISGDPGNEVAIVGASHDDDNGTYSGSAYVYSFNGANWVEEQKSPPPT